METPAKTMYTFVCRFIQILSLTLCGLLFLGGFLFTCYSLDMTSQQVLTRWDNFVWNLFGTALFIGITGLITALLSRLHSQNAKFPEPVKLLTVFVLLWTLALGAILVVFGKTVPAADALSVYRAAEELIDGNTGVIHPVASYLSYYPQQVGLMAFFELLHRFWRLLPIDVPAWHFMKCLYVLLACGTILFQKGIVRLLWDDSKAQCIYLLLIGANFPFIMYTSFIYGEIPSFAAISAGFYFLLKLLLQSTCCLRRQILFGLATLFFLILAVMLRKNSLIMIIAVLIVVLLHWLDDRRAIFPAFALLCALGCFSVLPLIQKSYELRAGNTLSSGVPAISYLAMGMQESSRANGWYNGFNFDTYSDTGMDADAAAQISREAIRERFEYFREHPDYAADFYLHKHLSQWADGTYASRQATLATYGGRTSFFDDLYTGKYSGFFIEYANLYQNVLYLGALLFCAAACRKPGDNKLPIYLGFICVVGGFLFHMAWEANSRYIFPYSLLLIPYCARGLALLLGQLQYTIANIRSHSN